MAFSIGSWYWTVATHDGILREQAGDISPGKQFNVRVPILLLHMYRNVPFQYAICNGIHYTHEK